jgi:hypothetical protein
MRRHKVLDRMVASITRGGIIKYVLGSRGTQTREGLHSRGPAATLNYRPVLSSERALENNKPSNCLKKIARRKKNWSRALVVA